MPLNSEKSAKAKGQFLEIVSQEVRAPLTAISGMSQLLADTKLNTTQSEFVATIQTASFHLLSLIDNLLDVTKLGANELELVEDVLDVSDELHAAARDVNCLTQEKEITISVECTPDVPGHKILDRRRFRQCLSNLLENAIKFTKAGKVSLSCWVEPDKASGGILYISVTDTGPGVPLDEVEKIFHPFHQQDKAKHPILDGAGLGLPVTRELARLMGGDVEVTSPPGCGSTFTLSIQYTVPQPKPVIAEEEFGKILVVEDNQTNQRLIQLVLQKLGHHCDLAVNGQQGVDMFNTSKYDLILMDLHMPVMDGFEATANIRASGKDNCDLPIIALTADVRPGIEQRIIDAGMDAYISKPFEVPVLATSIATFLAIAHEQQQEQLRSA